MKIRLGYVALPVSIPITSSKTITVTNYKKLGKRRGEEKRCKILEENLTNFLEILKYNEANSIHFYRMTSHLVPLLTYRNSYHNISDFSRPARRMMAIGLDMACFLA